MNKRCIVNVATGELYCKQQDRLETSFQKCEDVELILFRDTLPENSRTHSESPYGFKIHAILKALEMGYTSILWLDSPAYTVKDDITPIFEKIERDGYYAMSHTDPLKNWVSDYCLDIFNVKREQVNTNLPSGSCYGFYFPKGHNRIFTELVEAERTDMFSLAYKNDSSVHHCRREVHRPINSRNPYREITGWHRHDEACLGMILLMFGLPTFHYDPLFQSDDPRCVIKSGA
jgi:hypothetical protein